MKLQQIIVCAIIVPSLTLVSDSVYAQGSGADAVIHVDKDDRSLAPPNFGQNGWESDAYKFLQDALGDAGILLADPEIESVEIWIASGTYFPDEDANNPNGSGLRDATFQMHNDVHIRGGFVGDEQNLSEWNPEAADPAILSGDLDGPGDDSVTVLTDADGNFDGLTFTNYDDNSNHIVTDGEFAVDDTAELNGFTIRGARDQAIVLERSDARIIDCIIKENKTSDDDGTSVESTTGIYEPVFRECQFVQNESNERAVRVLRGQAIMIDCAYGPVAAESAGGSL